MEMPPLPILAASCRRWAFGLAALLALFGTPAHALDLAQKSVSSSKQFTVYCADVALRGQVANFADELKGRLLELLGESDRWKFPILVTLERAAAGRPETNPVSFSLIEYEAGFKVQIDARIGADPSQ